MSAARRALLYQSFTWVVVMLSASYAWAQQVPQSSPLPRQAVPQPPLRVPQPSAADGAGPKRALPGSQINTSALPAPILERAQRHLAEAAEDAAEWQGAGLAPKAQPLYRPDLTEIAYYHVAVVQGSKPAGFMILSTGDHDMPVVQWSESGESPVAQLDARAIQLRRQPFRYYMLDVLSFAVEDEHGELIASLGDLASLPMRQQTAASPTGPTALGWKDHKASYRTRFEPVLGLLRRESAQAWANEAQATQPPPPPPPGTPLTFNSCGAWKKHWAGHHEQRWYDQIDRYEVPNNSSCASGCGATAWAMLFGWADYKAAQDDARWKYSKGIYRVDGGRGADAEAPKRMDAGVENMTWEISRALQTECAGDQGRTWPWNMEQARKYLKDRTTASLAVEFYKATNLVPSWELRDKADAIIRDGRPVIVALGWQHYALAYGYRKKSCVLTDQHEFRINDGGGEGEGRWTSANTWFVGQLTPAPQPSTGVDGACGPGKVCARVSEPGAPKNLPPQRELPQAQAQRSKCVCVAKSCTTAASCGTDDDYVCDEGKCLAR